MSKTQNLFSWIIKENNKKKISVVCWNFTKLSWAAPGENLSSGNILTTMPWDQPVHQPVVCALRSGSLLFACSCCTGYCKMKRVRAKIARIYGRRQIDDSFSYFFLENRIWHFMQIVSIGDNLHETSNYVPWKIWKIEQNVVCWSFT